ncbi:MULTISPECIES: ABC transporter permease subunit [Paenibacillus]|uniref:Protein lplB n=1 Tax=Paenibacillus odorifer TaxID=189426 RepID=A0A1R0Z5P1_9BACL|nr:MULTISPECIES: ABC transporter permease subunit [Paenibacillus]AIQ74955.1 protein lplB [Paenibacillus odorifer]AWV34272.1 protein lplB [Paenibacillus odorifer]ETT45817.1 binding-protein-dependent transport system inner membrane protein [Paenibacillus sp. FSL H8-237]MEC0133319.1 ABC transporter permease subunit [Paenibacillus odorifer]MEC0221203.1 ABC transporter permease subunit [Paenibacillus odorifer]
MNPASTAGIQKQGENLKPKVSRWTHTWRQYKKNKYLFLLLAPVIIWYTVFAYGPMYGIQLAFKDYFIRDGIWGSPWVGFKHFEYLFTASPDFWKIIKNTLIISFYHIIFGFPAPIILALLFNELRFSFFKKVAQTISYLPHFLSWIVIGGILITLLSPNSGVVNYIIQWLGFDPIYFLGSEKYFRFTLVMSGIWKEIGWGTIIYLAALASIDSQMYEAAVLDGANRWKQTLFITIPSILPVIAILLILRVGSVLDAGFDQVLTLYSPAVYGVADTLDTYVYRIGLQNFQFSLTTAVGLFKNVVGLILVLFANFITKKMGQEGLY